MSISPPPDPPYPTTAPLPVLGHLQSRWDPSAAESSAFVTHAGEPVKSGLLYLAAPPPEIGRVLSVFSNLDADKGAQGQIGKRLLGAAGGFIVGMLLLLYITYRANIPFSTLSAFVSYALAGIVGGVVGFFTAKPKYRTSYVGEGGAVVYHYGGKNNPIGKAEQLQFDRADALVTKQTNQHYNYMYLTTSYNFTWRDAAGKPLHTIKGSHKHKDKMPPLDHEFWYAVAAENAWVGAKLPELIARVRHGETVRFPIKGRGTVGVSSAGMVIENGKKSETVPLDALENIAVELSKPPTMGGGTQYGLLPTRKGELVIKRQGAKGGFLGVGAEGVYKFPGKSFEFPNQRLFLALLAVIAGHIQGPPEAAAHPA